MKPTKIAIFRGSRIRWTIYRKQQWFCVADVVKAVKNTTSLKYYIKAMRRRDPRLRKMWPKVVTRLPIQTTSGVQMMNCANSRRILRIIQAVRRSRKIEPFKRWLGRAGDRTTGKTQKR